MPSQICRCFNVLQVLYERGYFDGEKVSVSSNITSKEYSIVSMEAFEIYAANHNRNTKKYVLSLDRYNYYMMNIVDYLIGNTDRHWGNWGVLVCNSNNKPYGDIQRKTEARYVEVLKFWHFVRIGSINGIDHFDRHKTIHDKIPVSVVLDLGVGKTNKSKYTIT